MTFYKIKQFAILARIDKPIGIYLLLWPTCWALWLAGAGRPDGMIVSIFIAGVILMRSAGCIMNDIVDHKLDRFVERTCDRPIAAKKITVKEALFLFFVCLFLSLVLVWQLNPLTIGLAFIGAFVAVVYPWMKRVTHLPQVGLGIAFSWGIPMAFSAETNTVPSLGWLLFAGAVLWPIIYDTMYAMADRTDDLKIGIKSTAILFGKKDRVWIGILQIIFLLLFASIGYGFRLGFFYYFSLGLVSLLFIFQQRLIKNRIPSECFKAFLNNNWVGFAIWMGIILS